jgi:hypothetical protein
MCMVRYGCTTGKHITRSTPDMHYRYIFTSGVLPAVHDICARSSHIRCAAGKLFSSSVLWASFSGSLCSSTSGTSIKVVAATLFHAKKQVQSAPHGQVPDLHTLLSRVELQ